MAHPLQMQVKESIAELKYIQRKQGDLISKRIEMLIVIKRYENKGGISKRDLSTKTGINHNSIVKWRNQYLKHGIKVLLKHGRKGFKPSILNKEDHEKVKQKLQNNKNGLQGYKELMEWVKSELNKDIKYTTLYEYCRRHFGSKIKVARKSHIKKDQQAVETFKKTSVRKFRK